jgi:hypothetical protein
MVMYIGKDETNVAMDVDLKRIVFQVEPICCEKFSNGLTLMMRLREIVGVCQVLAIFLANVGRGREGRARAAKDST